VARICIVTPGQIGANPRVVKEADALHAAGHTVSVIATRMVEHVEPRDLAVMRRRSWRAFRIDLRSPLRWTLLRIGQLGVRSAYLRGLARRPDFTWRAYARPLQAAAMRAPADLYMAHYPDALPAVAAAARKYGAQYTYDAEDFHPGDWPDEPRYKIERQLVRAIEARFLPGCAFTTAASPGIAEAYAETYGIAAPLVVLNAFPIANSAPAPMPTRRTEPGPSLYWFSQTTGPDRGLESTVRAIAMAGTRPHLYLRGMPSTGYADALLDLAQSLGVRDRIRLLAPDEPDRMEELAAAYDLGLCAETGHTASRRLCLTNKLFSFLLAGVPPLLSDTPAQARFAAEAGLSDLVFRCDDPAALAALIDGLLGDPARLAAARARAWRLGQERYNWERECRHLVEAVRLAGFRPTPPTASASALRACGQAAGPGRMDLNGGPR
jgi:glycosyltransferase involved in cell wall biosynthesis